MNNLKAATEKQIRNYYRQRDMMVQISHDKHIRYRTNTPHLRDNHVWLEGGYVENYFIFENTVHRI